MRQFLLPGVVFVACLASADAYANEAQLSNFEIISVIPRSPDVKPVFMSVPANGRRETNAHATPAPAPEKLASAKTSEPASPPNSSKQ
jgi:hypothetical protein